VNLIVRIGLWFVAVLLVASSAALLHESSSALSRPAAVVASVPEDRLTAPSETPRGILPRALSQIYTAEAIHRAPKREVSYSKESPSGVASAPAAIPVSKPFEQPVQAAQRILSAVPPHSSEARAPPASA
jgi:hypothetical protein